MPNATLETLLSQRASFLHFLERRVGERALAEDILQAAYIRALESDPLREEGATIGWFYQVLRNAVIDHYRRHASESAALERFTHEVEKNEPLPAPELESPFVCGCIATVLPALRPAYVEVLREVDIAETPLAEFARKHRLTPGNAAVRSHRARAALRQALEKFCGSCSLRDCLNCVCKTPASIEHA